MLSAKYTGRMPLRMRSANAASDVARRRVEVRGEAHQRHRHLPCGEQQQHAGARRDDARRRRAHAGAVAARRADGSASASAPPVPLLQRATASTQYSPRDGAQRRRRDVLHVDGALAHLDQPPGVLQPQLVEALGREIERDRVAAARACGGPSAASLRWRGVRGRSQHSREHDRNDGRRRERAGAASGRLGVRGAVRTSSSSCSRIAAKPGRR